MMNCLTPNYYTKLGKYKFQYTIKRKNRLPSNCDVPGRRLYGSSKLIWSIIIAYPLILIVLFWLPVLLQEEVLNRLVLLSRLLILLPKIIWAPEFHYLKIEMSSMFCPKQLIIYLTESKTQSKEKRNVWCFTWIEDPLTIIKGTLEVLIRKPRNSSEYEKKLTFVFMK
jgi:hypothetical protein